jgi:hypothetical protein
MKLVYSQDKTIVRGYLTDGKFVQVAPAPTGMELVRLIDECCLMIENFFGSMNPCRLHDSLRRTGIDGHSTILTDGKYHYGSPVGWDYKCGTTKHGGVRSWIEKGTLRSSDELSPVLNKFADNKKLLHRMHLIPKDWALNSDGLIEIGESFGLPSLPSEEERHAEWEAERAAERERQRLADERENATAAESEAKYAILERKQRVKRLLDKISNLFWTMDDLNLEGENLPPEYFTVSQKRTDWKKYSEADILINRKIDEGETDKEIMEEVTMYFAIEQGNFRATVPPELQQGERREYVSAADLANFIEDLATRGITETHDVRVCLSMDGRFAVTIRAFSEQEIEEFKQKDREVEQGKGVGK